MGDMGAGLGMLVVETIAKIRRAFFVQKKPIKVICREFRVSRKVVRKVIWSQATEFRYERGHQPLPRIDAWREQLDGLFLADEGKPARERLTLIRIFVGLRGLGYEGSYDAVRRYAKRWRAAHGAAMAEAYVPLSFAPGEAYPFDWSHEVVLINGTTVTVKVAPTTRSLGCGWCLLAQPFDLGESGRAGPVFEEPGGQRLGRAGERQALILVAAAVREQR